MAKGRGKFFVRKICLPIKQLLSKACCCSARQYPVLRAGVSGKVHPVNQGLDCGDSILTGDILTGASILTDSDKTLIARASYYQRQMSSRWAGRQCTSMAASSLALSIIVSPKDWRRGEMDQLLIEGDTFHGTQLKRLGRDLDMGNKLRVGWSELDSESNITVAGQAVMLLKESNYYGIVEPAPCVDLETFGALPLINALDVATRSSTGAILTVGDYSTGVMKVKGVDDGDEYMVFDSHSRNSEGQSSRVGPGTAVLLKFRGLDQLHKYIRNLYNSDDEFNIVSFAASLTDVEVDVNTEEEYVDTWSSGSDSPDAAVDAVVVESEECDESILCVSLAHLAKVAATINVALNKSLGGDKDGMSFIGYSPAELDN